MDGVLISSIVSVERSWTKWAEKHGVDPALAIRTAHGRRAIESIRILRPDLNDQEELRRIEDMELEDNEGVEILEGVQQILHDLPANRWAVVTSATQQLALSRLRYSRIPIPEHVVTADRVSKGKPDPEPYLMGAKLLGLRPEDCLVIEDAPSGVEAGHAAGCKVLATLFSHSMESLSAADWIVRSLKDVRIATTGNTIEVAFEPVNHETLTRRATAR